MRGRNVPAGVAAEVGAAAFLLPSGYAIAAGATLLFAISREVIPKTHRAGVEGHATVGLLVGVAAMMFLSAHPSAMVSTLGNQALRSDHWHEEVAPERPQPIRTARLGELRSVW